MGHVADALASSLAATLVLCCTACTGTTASTAATSTISTPSAATSAPAQTQGPTQTPTPGASAADRVASFLATGGHLCTAGDLRGRFRNGEEGAGNLLTAVVVGNVSGRVCAIRGPVRFVGLSATGRAVTPVSVCDVVGNAGQPCSAPRLLPPHATFTDITASSDPSVRYAVVTVVGFYRDDPQSPDGLCTKAHTVTPSTLRLAFGDVSLRVRNWDPADTSIPAGIHAVFGCHGAISL